MAFIALARPLGAMAKPAAGRHRFGSGKLEGAAGVKGGGELELSWAKNFE